VHPIERLRYVARASGADQALLVRETAQALASFVGDHTAVVPACRRIIDRHPTSGPLWWLCARVLTDPEPRQAAWDAVEAIQEDSTPRELAHALPEDARVCVVGWPELVADALPRRGDVEVLAVDALGEGSGLVRRLLQSGVDAVDVPQAGLGAAVLAGDLLLVEAIAAGPDAILAVSGSRAAAATARHAGVPVWATVGAGRLLPARLWAALLERLDDGGQDPWDLEEELLPADLLDQVCGPGGMSGVAEALSQATCPVAHELLSPGRAPGTR
jgi:hypothetical protein